MRRTASEKMEIIRRVEQTDLPVRATLRQLGVPQSTFYSGYQRYQLEGFNGLHDQKPPAQPRWNALPKAVQDEVLDLALKRTVYRRENSPATTPTKSATSYRNRACTES